ncbi:hypothetical protein SNEBB_007974, partial [Seison nebaliae]
MEELEGLKSTARNVYYTLIGDM